MTHQTQQSPQFFLTAPSPCPYLEGKFERKVFTHLSGDRAAEINDVLTIGGFRRSQNIAYRPACEQCRACVSVRIIINEFKRSQSYKRIWTRNKDLISTAIEPVATEEQYQLFRSYLNKRHQAGGMSDMSDLDYAMMVEDTFVNTQLIEYRIRTGNELEDPESKGELIAVALTDVLSDGLSMVYSFFSAKETNRSLGTYMILDHIQRARAAGLPYVYLGYWVKGSQKMHYKIRFQPQEHLGALGWVRQEVE